MEDISNEKNKMAIGRGTGLRNGQRYNRLQEKLEGVCQVNVPETDEMKQRKMNPLKLPLKVEPAIN